MDRNIFSVSQINAYVKSLLDRDKQLSDVMVAGEISNFKLHTSGHMYMSLKDDSGVLRSVMFRGAAQKLRFKPENGIKIIASGRITVYERDGSYQMYIDDMQPDGIGALHLAFEQLKAKLLAEGLFDASKKKPLPKFPEAVGIVTAPTGAAIRDMLNILSRRFSYTDVYLYPSLVQGEGAAAQIAEGIAYFNESRLCDVVIIGRGGGSIEDLWAFNEELLARAIYESEIPIISAVGHEIDFTISDFAADVRAPTPSAAAELVVPSQAELMEKLNNVYGRIMYCANVFLDKRRNSLKNYSDSQVFSNPTESIDESRIFLDSIYKDFSGGALSTYSAMKQRLSLCVGKLDVLSPLSVMGRGYSIAKDIDGTVISSVKQVSSGDRILVSVKDGDLDCRVM